MPGSVQKAATLWGVFVCAAGSSAPASVYPISSFPRLQGVIVRAAEEDAHGVIWLGTDDGIWRWTNDRFEPAQTELPEGTRIFHLALLSDQRMLLACTDGLRAVDTTTQKLDSRFRMLEGIHIFKILIAPDGAIWLGTATGVFRLTQTGSHTQVTQIAGTEAHPIYDLISDGGQGVWAGSDGTVFRISPDDTVTPVFTSAIGKGKVVALELAEDGSIWIGQRWPGQLTRISESTIKVFSSEDGLTDTRANDIMEYSNGEIWVATESGVFRLIQERFHSIDRNAGLPNPDIHYLYADSEDQIWIGTFGHGVFRLRSPYVTTYLYQDGLAHPVITSVRNGVDDTLIVGTVAGAVRLDPVAGVVERLGPGDYVKTIFSDDTGEIWIARYLDCFRASDQRFVSSRYTTGIIKDGDGHLIFCGSPGPMRLIDGTLQRITISDNDNRSCILIADGTDRSFLVFTNYDELYRISDTKHNQLWKGEPISAMVAGDDGRVLVGMRRGMYEVTDHGVTPLIDRRHEPFLVRDFAKDGEGRLWAATDHGIARIDGRTIEWFDFEDGLPTRDIRSVVVGTDGYLYAGTTQGLARIDKKNLRPCVTKPHFVVEGIVTGSQQWQPGEPALRAEYPANDVAVHFKANGWRSCVSLHYQYKLLGRDADWSAPTTSATWRGSDLSWGDYLLLAKAINHRGIETQVLSTTFSLLPPFWQGTRFRVICAGVAVLLGILMVWALRRRRTLRRALQMSERAKREFVSRMSHELRTPLTVLIASAELIARDSDDTTTKAEHLRSVMRNGEHLLRVVNDILDLATLTEGRELIRSERVDLHQLLNDTRDVCIRRVRGKDVTVLLDVEADVPRRLHTDPTKLRQILINLLDNAGKFTDHGTIRLHASLRHGTGSSSPLLHITVTDTGPGIPPDRLAAIFEAFEQNDATMGRQYGGTGLGLTIARSLAVALGGRLGVTSELGLGSSFSLVIPVTIDTATDDADTPPPDPTTIITADPSPTPPGRILKGIRVALADDHQDVRRILTVSLEELGADVSSVSSGQALIECCTTNTFDIALIDIHMPDPDGLATLHALRQRHIMLPALAVTADVTTATVRQCLEAGFVGVLAKPFHIEDLVEAIRPLVDPAVSQHDDIDSEEDATMDHIPEPQDASQEPLYSDLASASPRLAQAAAEFVGHFGKDLERLHRAARKKDAGVLRETAHRLKGAGGINGYFSVSEVASELEQAIIRRDFDATSALLVRMEQLHTRMVNGLRNRDGSCRQV